MDEKIVIRHSDKNDWKAIQKLNLQIFEYEVKECEPTSNVEYPFLEEAVKYFKDAAEGKNGHCAIIAELNGCVVGYATLREVSDKALTYRVGIKMIQLHTLSVDKNYRNKGIGRKLVEYAKDIARNKGANRLTVWAYSKNERARHLYRTCGFNETQIHHEVGLS